MSRRTTAAIVVVVALLGSAAVGCRDSAQRRAAAERAREWTALRRDKQAIDAERAELHRLRGRLAAAPIEPDGTPAVAADAALSHQVAERERRLTTRSSSLGERLVRYLAGFERRGGGEPGDAEEPGWREAVRLKSDEDIAVAQEWVDRGGDYRHAIEILETQRALDEGYARLEEALVRAREMRFVTPVRFARVQPGMSPIDVRAALGPVNLREVLRRPAERLEAWYYPKRDGGKAAVYFRYEEARRGYVVYQAELSAAVARPVAAPAS